MSGGGVGEVSGESLSEGRESAHALAHQSKEHDGLYAVYVLGVLLLFNILNYMDRSVLTILAEDVKADLDLSDAQLGFLSGTAFAVFYATFGLVLGRLADTWNRTRLMSIGLAAWSAMTAMSGLVRSFLPLAVCRFGVAVGEAGAAPSAYSLIYDYFSPKFRTIAIAVYVSGVSIGGGLGLFVGGAILAAWPDPELAPFGLKGWQAVFLIVGLPGILVAILVSRLYEPLRGHRDGIIAEPELHPFRKSGRILISMIPIANIPILMNEIGGRAAALNIVAIVAITLGAGGLISLTDNIIQWASLGCGVYAAFCWGQVMMHRDPVVFGMIFKCRTLLCVILAAAGFSSMIGGIPFWAVPYFQRHYGLEAFDVGAVLGIGGPITGIVGLLLGGALADRLSLHTKRGKLYVWFGANLAAIMSAFLFLLVGQVAAAFTAILALYFFMSVAGAPGLTTINDLVLPRGRATTSSFTYLTLALVGGALGPYLIGNISDVISGAGVMGGEALRQAMLWSLLLPIAAIAPALYALRHIVADQSSLRERARNLGENI